MQRSKTYRAAEQTYDKDEVYSPFAAIKIANSNTTGVTPASYYNTTSKDVTVPAGMTVVLVHW